MKKRSLLDFMYDSNDLVVTVGAMARAVKWQSLVNVLDAARRPYHYKYIANIIN
jgi:hypothetical protein